MVCGQNKTFGIVILVLTEKTLVFQHFRDQTAKIFQLINNASELQLTVIFMHPGPFCPRHGTVSLQWSQHDGVPHPQHRKLSGVVDHREVVNGAPTSPAQTGLRPAGWIHDGKPNTSCTADAMHTLCCVCKNTLIAAHHPCVSI